MHFRLRRLLKEMLPEHEYICTDGGIYRWDEGNVTVSIDARNFEKAAQSALATGKKRSCATPAVCITGNSFLR